MVKIQEERTGRLAVISRPNGCTSTRRILGIMPFEESLVAFVV